MQYLYQNIEDKWRCKIITLHPLVLYQTGCPELCYVKVQNLVKNFRTLPTDNTLHVKQYNKCTTLKFTDVFYSKQLITCY